MNKFKRYNPGHKRRAVIAYIRKAITNDHKITLRYAGPGAFKLDVSGYDITAANGFKQTKGFTRCIYLKPLRLIKYPNASFSHRQ